VLYLQVIGENMNVEKVGELLTTLGLVELDC
jgi:hypothetical protein